MHRKQPENSRAPSWTLGWVAAGLALTTLAGCPSIGPSAAGQGNQSEADAGQGDSTADSPTDQDQATAAETLASPDGTGGDQADIGQIGADLADSVESGDGSAGADTDTDLLDAELPAPDLIQQDAESDAAAAADADLVAGDDVAATADVIADASLDAAVDAIPDTSADAAADAPLDVPAEDVADTASDASGTDTSAPIAYASLGQPCKVAADCGAGMVCRHAGCNGPALCVFAPISCPAGEPVCGCDGKDYPSECAAVSASVGVANYGACGSCTSEYSSCWGPCPGSGKVSGSNPCLTGGEDFCSCEGAPVHLLDVCMYLQEKQKNGAIAWAGQCPGEFGTCGSIGQPPCGPGAVCVRTPGQCGGGGLCIASPVPAGCPTVVQPVCACDGKTYNNACLAMQAGSSVAYAGSCTATATPCAMAVPYGSGGSLDVPCPSGQTCLSVGCGPDLAYGTCLTLPAVCPTDVAPVCGCDGKDYANACVALKTGMPVKALAACK